MNNSTFLNIHNCEPVLLADIPVLDIAEFRAEVIAATAVGARLISLFGWQRPERPVRLLAVLAFDVAGRLTVGASDPGERYPALTPECPQAHMFERELAEQFGIVPEGHPWLKPVRFHHSYIEGRDAWGRPGDAEILPCVTDFFQVAGDEVHEVAVGPVHAGVIEPGHFRFQCHGERVFSLEISLGYQHRGIERALIGGPNLKTLHFMETLAGDTSVAHAAAYCQAVETLSGCHATPCAQAVRGIALELERLANHIGDLGALANDVAYLPTASYCGRIRGDYLNLTAALCGNRFGRNLLTPGGVKTAPEPKELAGLSAKLKEIYHDTVNAVELLWNSPSVLGRFEDTGRIDAGICRELGIVGPAARACGIKRDIRFDFPSGIYRFAQLPVAVCNSGDVFARAMVRWLEIRHSFEFISSQLAAMPNGKIAEPCTDPGPELLAVSLVEGWRGEVCHIAVTGPGGRFQAYKVVDPSFHNWPGLAMSLRNEEISNFPLCNKSFNLSYCGHDL